MDIVPRDNCRYSIDSDGSERLYRYIIVENEKNIAEKACFGVHTK